MLHYNRLYNRRARTVINRLKALRDAHCYGYSDGYIATRTEGGMGDYRYLWNTGATSSYVDSVKAGSYTVVVTDGHNCRDTASYMVSEPEELQVNLGDDIMVCPGNSYQLDGGEYASYSWRSVETDREIEKSRYCMVSAEGDYAIVVTNDIGCFARDTVNFSIGNDALIANFLMASDAAVNDTIALIELSNIPVDSIRWEYQTSSFKDVTNNVGVSDLLHLFAEESGRFYITMWAYSGGCQSYEKKQIEIFDSFEDVLDFKIGYDPLIKLVKVSPNPNNGEFVLSVKLRETADIVIQINYVNTSQQIERLVMKNSDTYSAPLDIKKWGSGMYVLTVFAENERRAVKVMSVR
ncbi:MAG: T9SS type A sorting domain-containing protein [Marinilabiliaceae bacterium]|nr:T9SS type A sorting domain-containing protein [Marinilabiliaceae bacterium]